MSHSHWHRGAVVSVFQRRPVRDGVAHEKLGGADPAVPGKAGDLIRIESNDLLMAAAATSVASMGKCAVAVVADFERPYHRERSCSRLVHIEATSIMLTGKLTCSSEGEHQHHAAHSP